MQIAAALLGLIYAAALLVSLLSLTAAIVFWKFLGKPRSHLAARATLILPLTGTAENLERLLAALGAQTLAPRRLLIAVESEQDPAYRRALALSQNCNFPVEVVVAGLADACAQKCWNQIAALHRVDAQDEAVVLLDADIAPPPWWLSSVVTPLVDGSADIVTGYRWPLVERPALGVHLIAAIDRSIAVLPRFSWARGAWGGTLGLSSGALLALELAKTIGRTLTDDCPINDRAASLRLRVLTRRVLLVPTHLRSCLGDAWRFGRRQYQIIRIYRPKLWSLAFAAITARVAAWIAILNGLPSTGALTAAVALLAIALAGAFVQQMIARRLDCADPPSVRIVQLGLAIGKPIVDLVHWTMIVSAFRTGSVVWGHVTYKVRGPFAIQVAQRIPWG